MPNKRKSSSRKTSQPRNPQNPGRPRRRQSRSRVLSAPRTLTSDFARSLSDPWGKSACLPDGSNGTGCFSVKQLVSLGTGAGGGAAGLLINLQSVRNFSFTDTLSTATTLTITGNYAAATAQTSINALYANARPVSGGIRVTYVSNTQTDQGILLLGQVSELVTPSQFNGASLGLAQSLMQNYKVFPLRSGGRITWRPQSMDDVMVYANTGGSAVASTTPPSIPYLACFVFGATASTSVVALCDVVVNYEGQYSSQTFLPGGVESATPKRAETGWYENALNAVRLLDPIMPFVSSTMTNALNSPVASTAMGMLFGAADRRGLPRLGYMQVD